MKKVPFEILAFFAVLLIGAGSIAFTSSPSTTFYLAAPTQQVTEDTIIIGGLNLGEPLGADIPALTGTHLASFKETRIHTQEGTTRYRQILRLSTNQFDGGKILHVRSSQEDRVGDFLVFQDDEPAFEYEMLFNPGLESSRTNNDLEDFEDVKLNILGKTYYLHKAEVNGDTLEIEFFGPSFIKFTDDLSDDLFSRSVEVNGRHIDARVKIKGIISNRRVLISSITYRFFPSHKSGGDVFVEPRHGFAQYLQEPQGLFHKSFNILYGGLQGGPVVQNVIRSSRGSVVRFDPRGDDQYWLGFTNTRGQRYNFPYAEIQGGIIKLGHGSRDLEVKEGSSSTSFNIQEGDYFIITSNNKISGTTNILELDAIDFTNSRAFFQDLAGTQRIVNFNSETGVGTLPAGGVNYQMIADVTNQQGIVVDQNNDGSFDGGRPRIVILGGGMVETGSSGSSINMNFRTKTRLFRDGSGNDEVVSFNIVKDGNDLDLIVPTQSELTLYQDKDRIRKGLTRFGVYFGLDDHDPSELIIEFPYGGGQQYAGVYATSAQAKGYVVITLELERFIKKE